MNIRRLKTTSVLKDSIATNLRKIQAQVQTIEVRATIDPEVVAEETEASNAALRETIRDLRKTVNDLTKQLREVGAIDAEDVLESLIAGYATMNPQLAYASAQQSYTAEVLTTFYTLDDRVTLSKGLYDYFKARGFANSMWYDLAYGLVSTMSVNVEVAIPQITGPVLDVPATQEAA